MKPIKAQQEMVGFILIVALVVIALMVFLVISVKKNSGEVKSMQIDSMLEVMLRYTTECAITFEPQYSDLGGLIKDCYDNRKCSNLNKMACAYLNESLNSIMSDLLKTETSISAYKLEVFHKTKEEQVSVLVEPLKQGNCTGSLRTGQTEISTNSGNIIVKLTLCSLDI